MYYLNKHENCSFVVLFGREERNTIDKNKKNTNKWEINVWLKKEKIKRDRKMNKNK